MLITWPFRYLCKKCVTKIRLTSLFICKRIRILKAFLKYFFKLAKDMGIWLNRCCRQLSVLEMVCAVYTSRSCPKWRSTPKRALKNIFCIQNGSFLDNLHNSFTISTLIEFRGIHLGKDTCGPNISNMPLKCWLTPNFYIYMYYQFMVVLFIS